MAEDKPPAVGGDNITPGEDSTIAQMLAKAGKTLLMSFPKTFFRHSYIEQPLAFVLDKYANDLGAWPDRLPDGMRDFWVGRCEAITNVPGALCMLDPPRALDYLRLHFTHFGSRLSSLSPKVDLRDM